MWMLSKAFERLEQIFYVIRFFVHVKFVQTKLLNALRSTLETPANKNYWNIPENMQ